MWICVCVFMQLSTSLSKHSPIQRNSFFWLPRHPKDAFERDVSCYRWVLEHKLIPNSFVIADAAAIAISPKTDPIQVLCFVVKQSYRDHRWFRWQIEVPLLNWIFAWDGNILTYLRRICVRGVLKGVPLPNKLNGKALYFATNKREEIEWRRVVVWLQ